MELYNIYLVEDEDNIRELLVTYLRKEGYIVTAFSSAKDAIRPSIHQYIYGC